MLDSSDTKETKDNPNGNNTGVITADDIPENSIAGPYPGEFKFGQNSVDEPKIDFIIEVKHKDGRISLNFESSNQWTRYVQPARDRHEQNLEFYEDKSGLILLRSTRQIKMGEQLFAWYSEPLARLNGVPFLSLQNIVDNQQYQCDKCHVSFRYPNPLKAHMMYKCKLQRPADVQLTSYMSPPYFGAHDFCISRTQAPNQLKNEDHTRYILNQSLADYRFKEYICKSAGYLPNPWIAPTTSSIYSVSPSMSRENNMHLSLSYQKSLFAHIQPIRQTTSCSFPKPSQYIEPEKLTSRNILMDRMENNTESRIVVPVPSEVDGEPLDNLPKSLLTKCKSGHICIFCGKFYSRKYGLKIHLRTHTGYKPLKCKVCFRPFGDPSNLNKHVRLHAEGDTPYRCEYCNKILVRRRDLERHIRSRHPQEKGSDVLDKSRMTERDESDDEIVVT